MAHLSSCYFCGSALETPVQTYELPGRELTDGTTVTLCSSCSEKLAVVLDSAGVGDLSPVSDSPAETPVSESNNRDGPGGDESAVLGVEDEEAEDHGVAVAGEGEETVEGGGDHTTTGEGDDTITGDDEIDDGGLDDPFEDEEFLADDDPLSGGTEAESEDGDGELAQESEHLGANTDVSDDEEPQSPDEDELSSTAEMDVSDPESSESGAKITGTEGSGEEKIGNNEFEAVEATAEMSADDEPPVEQSKPEQSKTDQSSPDQPTSDQSGPDQPATDQSGPDQPATDQSGPDQPTSDQSSPNQSSTDQSEPAETDSDDETGSQEQAKATISALEYNRVMRMLQNREFPVDRDEIIVVASSAYDLAQSECAQVIDLAVDRGLLDERDGELHRPGD